ncbi:hypothetical protein P3T76_001176 [Phytophthora citrophthora]|uniref:Uncharacterized protein n=1 Tax=Phytophthora citrophthora TaxID=4793 RepID=A0AAD9LSN1_9STRA|nr:hypothetical protein P3T76_001176 [Phytophthora citrophthora]
MPDGKGTLLLVGSAGGELVVLREELVCSGNSDDCLQEWRRFQLESAVQQICYDRDGEFIVGDSLGNLYAVTQNEILWKEKLQMTSGLTVNGVYQRRLCIPVTSKDDGAECFYPANFQQTVKAITLAKLLDVEKTLSNYVIVATGHKHLLVTHRGQDFGVIPIRTPITTLTSFPGDNEDVVLAAGEEGVIYRLASSQGKDVPDFRFAVEVYAKVTFPASKLLPVKRSESTIAKASDLAWICMGVDGEVALFHGQECVKQWSPASFSSTSTVELGFPVDLALLGSGDANVTHQNGVMVFHDRIHVFSMESTVQQ